MSFTSNFLEELEKKKKKRVENAAQDSGMLYRNKTATEDDIAPVVSKATSVKAVEAVNNKVKAEKEDERKWFQKGAFEDGYQFGDVTKSLRGTVGDVSSGLLKGVLSPIEGISDFILHGAGYVTDAIDGEGRGDVATFLHDSANLDTAGTLINPLEKYHSKNSLVGENVDKAENVIGAFGGQLGLAAATGGWSLLATGVSAAGSGMTEAYNNGATDAEAGIYGISIGAIEAGTEALSGGLGKYVKALGFSKGIGGLDDMFAKKLTSKITDLTLKNAAEWGIKATGEGLEEVLAGLGSAVAKKLTYMSEEDLGKLVKDENLLDSFLIGTVMSGVSQSGVIPGTKKGSLMEANKTKSDFVTGLTANEEAVVNKEVENRIAEKEADGEALTKKDKAEIYEKVVEDMKRGYISTDTIEEVLSGEGYKAYDGLVKESEEYNELYNTKSGELSEAQKDRLAELKAKNEAQSYEDQIKAARDKLSSDTFNLLKGERNGAGSLLGESYNERARRGQKYEADLTKYNEKQKAVVQKAIDSGILNNTNRTHEFVDMVAKISADKGVLFGFTDNAKLKESGFAIDGKSVNGYVTKDGVTLNIDSKKALDTVAGHEITHVLEGTELYGELQKAIFDYAKSKGEYQGRYDTLKKLYEGVEGADVDAELTADLVGDYLFSDSDFINKLSTEHRNVFQKIYDEIKYLCKVATAGSKEARELERVKRAFEKVYQADSKAQSGTKYSLNEFKDGQRFVSVEANQEQFDGLSVKEQTDLATKIIKERFQGRVIGIDNKAFVNGKTADEYTHPAKHLDADTYEAKMRASTELDNIMDAGFNFRNEADGKDGHTHSDAVGGFDYFDAIFKVGSEYYQGVINIKNVNRGKLLKDITKIKNITQDMTSRYGENPSYAFLRDVSMEIVPQKETNVKGKFSLSSDSEGRQLPEAVKKRFGNSKVVDENGSLKVVYHGTATGEFSIFDKAKGSVEGDYGSGFYFTDNEADVSEHYEGGGPDFDNKVGRRADEIWGEEPDIEYEEAERRAREELYKGSHKFEVYLNMQNPATVGETMLFEQESYLEQYNEEDYDDYDDYMGDVEQLITDDIDGIIWDIERNVDINSTDGIANVLYDAVAEGGIGLEDLKKRLNDLYLEDSNGQLVANEVARQIIESLGYDGIIDPTVSDKWNMDIEPGTTHYIVFKPNQIKAVTNENPTDNPDIHRSLSAEGETSGRYGNVYGEGVKFTAPVAEDLTESTETAKTTENTAPIQNAAEGGNEALEDIMPEGFAPVTEEDANTLASENLASLDDADAPAEVETEYYEALDNTRVDDKAVKDISKSLADVLALDAKETEAIGNVVQRYSTGEISEAELFDEIKSKFSEKTVEHIDEQTAEVKRALRDYKLFVSDTIKGDIPEYNNLRKKLFGRLFTKTRENGGMPVDTAYMELSERYPGYFPEDIINPTDQFLLMAQYAQDDAKTHERYKLDDEDIQSAVDVIVSEVGKTKEAAVMQNAEEDRRALMDEIAPVAEKTPDKAYEAIRPPKQSNEPKMKRAEPRMKRADSTKTAPDGMEERSWYETSTGSEAVDNMITPDDIPDDVRYYQVKSNEKTLAAANARLAKDGYAKSREYFEGRMSERKLSVEDIALGERLIQEAAKAGDAKAVRDLIIDVSIIGTELGQRVQALSMIRRLTPEGQLKALTRTVERGKAKGDKAFEGVEITQEMIDHILKTYGKDGTFDQTELNAAVEDVKQQIADQMSVGAMDYINAWRYLSMLGNPKTHIRNVVSNVAMFGTRTVKNAVARTIETIAPIKNRTKTWRSASDAVKSFAEQTTKEMESAIKGENKYSDEGGIKAKRNIFKTKAGNWMANANNAAMDFEDSIFSKRAFRQTLSEYLTANGINTEADIKINPSLVEKAKDYALEESRRATFRQDSYLANKISEIERKNPLLNMAIGSIMPFKKTPINVAKTGLAYSPLGIARNIYDAVQVSRGKMDASEAIDHLAQTFTGSALALIGYALAEAGLLNGAGDDDKEGKYDYQLGEQSYSFNFGGDSYSLSWLSPVAMPLFVGANAYEQLVEGKEWNPDVVTEALAQTLDPLSEMSFISSLNDVLSSYDSGVAKIWGAGESMIQNYITQFVPTLSSQIAQTADDTKRSTKVAADSTFKFGEETLNKIKYKIPGLRNTLEPTTDIWGNEVKQSENILERGFEAFFSPANKRAGITTAVDEEIKDLYGQTGDAGVMPSIPDNYINYDGNKYEMSAKDFTEYKELYGQNAFDLMEQLFDTETYKNADSETRADMVNRVYDYARDEARKAYFTKFGVDFTNATLEGEEVYKENPIKGAIEADLPVDEYVFSKDYPAKYSFFKKNGISYETYKAADEDGKRAYTWAYENPGKYQLSKAISDDFLEFYGIRDKMNDFNAKDSNGNSVSGLKKERVTEYINGLDLDYGQKIILFRSMYDSKEDKNTYNAEIVEYLNSRGDIGYSEMVTILKELGMTVDRYGNVSW